MRNKLLTAILLTAALLLAAACGGDDNASGGTASPSASARAAASPPPAAAPPPGPGATLRPVSPPLEGSQRATAATTRTNFRELPEFALPSPDDLPEPPADATGPEFHPPADPSCPPDWQVLQRPVEGFQICYPGDWVIDGHGYVSAADEDRWYSVGFFLRHGATEIAHVSLYVLNPYDTPFNYTKDCNQAYRVTFSGQPAVLCPDHQGVPPEVKILTYQIRRGDLDYYVNVVPRYTYDTVANRYLDQWDKDVEATAIQIAQTLQFVPLLSPG